MQKNNNFFIEKKVSIIKNFCYTQRGTFFATCTTAGHFFSKVSGIKSTIELVEKLRELVVIIAEMRRNGLW